MPGGNFEAASVVEEDMRRTSTSLSFALAVVCVMLDAPTHADTAAPRPQYPDAKASYEYLVNVRDFYGAEGFGFDCYLDGGEIVLVYWDDFGSKPKEVFRRALT